MALQRNQTLDYRVNTIGFAQQGAGADLSNYYTIRETQQYVQRYVMLNVPQCSISQSGTITINGVSVTPLTQVTTQDVHQALGVDTKDGSIDKVLTEKGTFVEIPGLDTSIMYEQITQ